mgnify:CR=1 FL=1
MVDVFVREKIVRTNEKIKISQKEVYEKYVIFCKEHNEQAETVYGFGRRMKMFGHPSKAGSYGKRIYVGIKVKD